MIVSRLLRTYLLKTFFHLGVKEGEKQRVVWPGMWLFFKAKT